MTSTSALDLFVRTHVVRAPESVHERDLAWYLTSAPHDELNGVLAVAPSRVAAASAAIGAVPALWHSWPEHPALDVEAALTSRGFVFVEEEPVMVRSELEGSPTAESVSGINIREAESLSDLASWVEVWTGGEQADPRIIDALRSVPNRSDAVYLLAESEGRPVGCAAAIIAGDAVAVEHVVTHADYRRRGIGTLLTARTVQIGLERGAHTAVLTASPDGAALYERLGFVVRDRVRRFLAPDVC